ncbi:MAG: GntR family transcriptional regulator [Anaerolineales bacterium]|nr:GntR family transcriptional regulator [Anaerolineales bacterium]
MVDANENSTIKGSPLYQQTSEALEKIITETAPGDFLPSEPKMAKLLGISRATLREAMRTFEERGLIVRRQGVGTIVTSPTPILEAGLEVLESIETIADRIGLDVTMGELRIVERNPDPEESTLLEVSQDETILEVSRVILGDSRPVAFLIDVLPRALFPPDALEKGFTGSVLDFLLRESKNRLKLSRTEITAVSASTRIARQFKIQRGDVLLQLEAYLYTDDGRAIDHSHSYFLPGIFRFHVVRRVEHSG